jgi:2-polyprenyl-3-methyl-5-hydroxy-6-metoxy-1,4-benzoquinol methylase
LPRQEPAFLGSNLKAPPLNPVDLSADEFALLFEAHGGTDREYLSRHYPRYVSTLVEFCLNWKSGQSAKVLDVGAHWLHQSVMWRKAGFEVSAVDLPATLEIADVQSVARAMDIALITCPDLESAEAFNAIPDSSVDIILFTEIIEHLTFNPIGFWKQIHRILAPGGRLVVTTPNYYAWNGRAWAVFRFLRGLGGGISVDSILRTNTYGHHWREFSMGELFRYFSLLSPDFRIIKAKKVRRFPRTKAKRGIAMLSRSFETFPGLRPNLYLEVELVSKERGIVVNPAW